VSKNWTNDEIKVGDEVSYRPVSLWQRKGVVVTMEGKWATVRWSDQTIGATPTKEWLPNLQAWKEQP
jgi:hypothetical protein